jgi:hypothetical protein
MFASEMRPSLRPTIIILLDDAGISVYQRLTSLTAGLDAVTRHGVAVVRYDGAGSERLPVVALDGSDDDEDDEEERAADSVDAGDPGAPLDTGPFNQLMINAICDIQDVRNLDRIRRAGIHTPDPLAQLIVVGRADCPYLGRALSDARQSLAEAALELGATIRLEAPILCVLADYGTASRTFTEHVRTSPSDDWNPGPENLSELADLYRSQTGGAGQDGEDDPVERLRREAADTAAAAASLGARAGGADAWGVDIPPATFHFLYSRLRQDLRAALSVELIEYLMAQAVFSLAATGQTLAPSMAEVVRATPGVSATKDRVGSLGACMIRFPRAEAERYCVASLGGDLLEYWSGRERAARHGPDERATREARLDGQREEAYGFVNELLTPWIRADILADMPDPGPDGWPDADTFANSTLDAGRALDRTRDRMANALAREEIERRIAGLDRTGREWRRPEWLGERWKEVTAQAWRDYEDIHTSQLEPMTTSAYQGVSKELARFLGRHVDDIWLNPDQGWEAAGAYSEALSDALYGALDNLARDRVDAYSAYEQLLQWYEELIEEADRDREAGGLEGGEEPEVPIAPDGSMYTPMFQDQPTPAEVRVEEYHATDSDLYNEAATIPASGRGAAGGADLAGAFTPSGDPAGAYAAAGGADALDADTPTVRLEPPDGGDVVTDEGDGDGAPEITRAEREERVLRGIGDLVTKRLLDQRMIFPALALALVCAPVLTLVILAQLTPRWPLSVGLVTVIIAGVSVLLGAIIFGLWRRARQRAEEAMALHISLMEEIARRRQQDLEDQLRVYVINIALANAREMREHLRDWPERVQRLARQLRERAQETSDSLFNGPAGYHDILIANGARLRAPDPALDGQARGRPRREDSPLWPVYARFSDDRSRRPREPWHGSLDSILDALRGNFRAGTGGVIGMSDEAFAARLMRFLRGNFHAYLRGEIGRISAALDPLRNPTAVKLWAEAREHATPPHGAPGGEILYIAGQREDLSASADLGVEHTTQRITTRASQPHTEWLLATTLRRGGIPL